MKSKVYLKRIAKTDTKEVTALNLKRAFIAAGLDKIIEKNDLVGIKMTFGEEDNKGYINPVFVKGIVECIKQADGKPFIAETNTLYKGQRSNTVDHLNLALKHGFNPQYIGAPIIIGDGLLGHEQFELEIDKKYFKTVRLAAFLKDTDCIISLSHVTGHILSGFAGSLKNIGMGLASRAGKLNQHSNVLPEVKPNKCNSCAVCLKGCPVKAIAINKENKAFVLKELCIGCGSCTALCRFDAIEISWSSTSRELQEKMVEYAFGAIKDRINKTGYVNFLTHFTKDCDCLSKDSTPIIDDIGMLVSVDPVAIDKASVELINENVGKDIFKEMYPEIDYSIQLKYAEKIGIGDSNYELIKL
jgi:uncharacterized Fe-S center protein